MEPFLWRFVMESKLNSEPPIDQDPSDVTTSDERKIRKLSDLFSLLGSDPEQNIHLIVQQACDMLDSAFSLYNRLDDEHTSLVCCAGYQLPPDYADKSSPHGQISLQVMNQRSGQPLVVSDLSKTTFAANDPMVQRYGLKTCVGCPIVSNQKTIGALCVVDTRVRTFSEGQLYILRTLAKAISLQEEFKQVETALSRSEKKYRSLYKTLRLLTDNAPDLIWAKDLNGDYIFANQAICDKLLKCGRPEEAVGKSDAYFATKEIEAGYQYTFGLKNSDSDELVKQRKSPGRFVEEGLVRNQRLVLDVHKAPFWDEKGDLIGIVGCGRDVTKERRTAQALLESERRYRDLYNNTPVMLYSLDHEDRITSASNLWLEIMGYEREEVIGRHTLDFFSPESRRDALEVSLPEFYKRGQMKNRPFQFITKFGKMKEVLLSAIAQRDAEGNYTGALAFVVDVTTAKRAEREKRHLSIRLQQAQKMDAIATLAGGVAHQFNNALAVILGNLEMIQMDGLADEKLERFISPINQAGQKMVQLTSQLLAYARGGKFQTQIVQSHLFVKEALSLVNHTIAPYVELQTELDETADSVEVDTTQMQMLLAAILSNASEAIEKKGTIKITLANVEIDEEEAARRQPLKPGRHVLLQITDTGQGMDRQTCNRIFEPFFTTKFQGRGLGMAAVYGIVKMHGGFVYVDSELGKGTVVSIFLPGIKAAVTVPEKTPASISHHSGTALIVEDEHMVMEINRTIVEKLGYHVLEARTGKEAVEIAQTYKGRIDFALLDVILPDMSGSQIYPELKKLRPDLKVIVCSGFSLDGPARQMLNDGAETFLSKPFSVAALSSTLDDIFKKSHKGFSEL